MALDFLLLFFFYLNCCKPYITFCPESGTLLFGLLFQSSRSEEY